MAALSGFDIVSVTQALAGPFTLGQIIAAADVAPRFVVAGLDLTVSDLDTNAAPAIALDVGDDADTDRFLSGSTIARAGGTVEVRPASTAWHRYTVFDTVDVRVATAPATSAATGTLSLTVYVYPATDYAALRRMVLQELGYLAAGEEVRAEDGEAVDAALSETHESFRFKRMHKRQDLEWPLSLVPMFAARSYALLAAQRLSDVYGLSDSAAARVAQRAVGADQELRRMTRLAHDGEPVAATYF